jgi:hypothetical protein
VIGCNEVMMRAKRSRIWSRRRRAVGVRFDMTAYDHVTRCAVEAFESKVSLNWHERDGSS